MLESVYEDVGGEDDALDAGGSVTEETDEANDEAVNDIKLTNRSAQENNPVAVIFNTMADARPHPHPARWKLGRNRLIAAYVFQTPSPVRSSENACGKRPRRTPKEPASPVAGRP